MSFGYALTLLVQMLESDPEMLHNQIIKVS